MDNDKHFGPLIKVLGKVIEQTLTVNAQKIDLTSAQLFILRFLSKHTQEEINQKDIEHNFELSHATVSGLIRRLEAKAFITSVPSENDKRFKCIKITDKAIKCEEEMHNNIIGMENKLLTGFSAEEKDLLYSYLLRMTENMDVPFEPRKCPGEDKK